MTTPVKVTLHCPECGNEVQVEERFAVADPGYDGPNCTRCMLRKPKVVRMVRGNSVARDLCIAAEEAENLLVLLAIDQPSPPEWPVVAQLRAAIDRYLKVK